MSEEEQETLEFLLVQALFSAEVLFSFVENPYVIQFFNYFWPSFKLSNRRKIADELLDKVYEEVKVQVMNKFLKQQLFVWFLMVGLILIKSLYKILLFVFQNLFSLMLHF